jgi:ABC-type multidrug transport system ATPase subunit
VGEAITIDARLTFDRVSLRFGRQVALSDATLHCRDGAVTCLVGPNGAGKSSALALAAGLLRPDSGRVLVDGKAVAALAHTDGVSYLPQTSFFPGLLTAREVLDFAITLTHPPVSRVADVLHVT